MVDITEISAIVAAAGVLVGVVYYILEMRHQTRIRKTDLYMKLYSTVMTHEYLDATRKIVSLQTKDYREYSKQYGSLLSESPMHEAFFIIGGFYDFVGILLYRNQIDINLVYDVIGSRTIQMMWGKLEPVVMGARKDFGESLIFAGFEYLHNELVRNEPQLKKSWTKAFLESTRDVNSLDESSGVKNG